MRTKVRELSDGQTGETDGKKRKRARADGVSGHSKDRETAGKAETFGALLATSRRAAGERSTGKTRFPNYTHGDRSGTALDFTIGWDGW